MVILFTLISLFLWSSSTSLANDSLTLTCDPGCHQSPNCQPSPVLNKPLFSITDIKPGYIFYEKLILKNSHPSQDCDLYFSADKVKDPANLSGVLSLYITRDTVNLYGDSVSSIFSSASPIFLDKLPHQSGRTYLWKLTMDPQAGNIYQNKQLKFNLDVTFHCTQQPSPKPTSTPRPTPTPTRPTYRNCFKIIIRDRHSLLDFLFCLSHSFNNHH